MGEVEGEPAPLPELMIYASFDDMLNEIPLDKLAEYVAIEHLDAIQAGERPEAALLLVNNALQAASDLINGYIKGRYPALAEPPAMLKKICTSIASSYLQERRYIAEPTFISSILASRAEQIKLLEAIAKGDVSIGIATAEPASSGFKMKTAERPTRLSNLIED